MPKKTKLDIMLDDIKNIKADNIESMRRQAIHAVLNAALDKPTVTQNRVARLKQIEFAASILGRGVAVETAVQKIMVYADCSRRVARGIVQEAVNGR